MADQAPPIPIVPFCRYGHGPLDRADPTETLSEWNVIAIDGDLWHSRFAMLLYVCPKCGYVEFFNDSKSNKIPLG